MDSVQRFLFDDLDIRGAVVQLRHTWQAIYSGRSYPNNVRNMLGQMCAVTALISANLKQPGRLTFQLRGSSHLSLLVIDCSEQLNLRGYARADDSAAAVDSIKELLADGRLLMTLDTESARQPYQSFVPADGNSVAEIFEHYLEQSEQQPAALFLACDEHAAAGLFLQRLPGAEAKDPDGWGRVTQLAQTVRPDELTGLALEDLLQRLFHEETLRVFTPHPVSHNFPQDWDKVRDMLRSLGQEEIEKLLAEHGNVIIHDDLSNHEYRFTADEARALFSTDRPTLH